MENFYKNTISIDEFEDKLLYVIKEAISKLFKNSKLPRKERELNKMFSIEVWNLRSNVKPFRIRPNSKKISNDIDDPSNDKEPEVTCELDYYSDPPIEYDIECKRLVNPKSNWCRYYVEGGIKRFLTLEHCYSRGYEKGLMVGYIIDLDFDDAFSAVNGYVIKNSYPIMTLTDGWYTNGISRLDQTFVDREFEPKPFYLRHLWVDFREKFILEKS